jgi:hypothetical protein
MFDPNKPVDTYCHACGGCLTPSLVAFALLKAGITWAMPTAQLFALFSAGLQNVSVVESDMKEEAYELLKSVKPTTITCYGLPVEVDNTLPTSTVELRLKGEVLYRIEALTIPNGF